MRPWSFVVLRRSCAGRAEGRTGGLLQGLRPVLWSAVPVVLAMLQTSCATCPLVEDGAEFTSSDGARVARVQGGTVEINGRQAGGSFDGIFSRGVTFSDDGKRSGFVGLRSSKAYPVVDGVEHGPYDNFWTRGVVFGPGGTRWASAVVRQGKWMMLIDGVEGDAYDMILGGEVMFSPDGTRVAYAARRKWSKVIVEDGGESEPMEDMLPEWFFTADGKLAYVSKEGGGWRVHIGAWSSEPFDWVLQPGPIPSPDGSTAAYVGSRDGKTMACINKACEQPYERIGAYKTIVRGSGVPGMLAGAIVGAALSVATAPVGVGVRVTQREGSDAFMLFSIIFSPDSRHHAYVAFDGTNSLLVVDGAERGELAGDVSIEHMVFNESSEILLYRLSETNRMETLPLPGAPVWDSSAFSMAEARPASATIAVNPDEPDCLVFVDGKYAGPSPVTVTVPPGKHAIRVEKEQFETQERETEVAAGRSLTLDVEMPQASEFRILTEVLEEYKHKHLLVAPETHPGQFANAKLSCRIPPHEVVMAVIDGTLANTAQECLVFTTSGIYVRNGLGKTLGRHYVPYDEMVRRGPPRGHPAFEVAITDDVSFNMSAASFPKSRLIPMLDELRERFAED